MAEYLDIQQAIVDARSRLAQLDVVGNASEIQQAAAELAKLEGIVAQGPIEVAFWEGRPTRPWLSDEERIEEEQWARMARILDEESQGGSPIPRLVRREPESVPPVTVLPWRLRLHEALRYLPTTLRTRRERLGAEVLLHARRALGVTSAGLTVFERRARARRAPRVAAYVKMIHDAQAQVTPRVLARRQMRERRTGS